MSLNFNYVYPDIDFFFSKSSCDDRFVISYKLKNLKNPWFRCEKHLYKSSDDWVISLSKHYHGCFEGMKKQLVFHVSLKKRKFTFKRNNYMDIHDLIYNWQLKKYGLNIIKEFYKKNLLLKNGIKKIKKTEDILKEWI